MNEPVLLTLLIAALGGGLFLRLVAKEKHRRERHLELRLEDQLRKIRREKTLAEKAAAEKAATQQGANLDATVEDKEFAQIQPALTSPH